LLKIAVIMACLLHENKAMFERTISTNTFYEGAEAFSRLLKNEGWTVFKVLVTLSKSSGEKACHVLKLSTIHSNIDRFISEHGKDFGI
jgi:hypothetical protein